MTRNRSRTRGDVIKPYIYSSNKPNLANYKVNNPIIEEFEGDTSEVINRDLSYIDTKNVIDVDKFEDLKIRRRSNTRR